LSFFVGTHDARRAVAARKANPDFSVMGWRL
jgi:hypothetical protein